MPGKPKRVLDLSATLRKVRDPIIRVECLRCDQEGKLIRAEIVRKHGVGKLAHPLKIGPFVLEQDREGFATAC
ncbi:hypothetical protein [Metarhizobium album]|uniref:hypothetical protein n=1 Tax=Metarhizobium album TaxID=2182425 RepID=UPI000FFF3734|nr:hypothetical protein [Rhizobium album]